jgi:glycosyltransferase involved in cell wall biosynthesis
MSIISFVIPLKEWETEKLELLFSSLQNIAASNRIEIIIIYSGLTPKKYTDRMNNSSIRISLIYSEPKGIYNAYNLGSSLATSKWIMFLGGDDFVFPSLNYLLKNLESFNSYDAIVCQVVFGGKSILKPFRLKQGLIFRNWCHQGVIYKKTLFDSFKYDEIYPMQADHKFNIEISKKHKIKFSNLVISYFNDDGLSQTYTDWAFYKDMPIIVKGSFGYFWSLISIIRKLLGKINRKLFKQ